MYNWRLLLLAFIAVFQPIASFTERNLVDGRQQCCDHRLSRESAHSLYGDNRFKSEGRYINDHRREIREVRSDDPTINRVRGSFQDREIRESPELRSALSRAELHRGRESKLWARNALLTPDRTRNYRATDASTGRIRNLESRRGNQFRVLRTDESKIFRARDVDENLDQRNIERRALDSHREGRHMRDNVDEVRMIRNLRDTREELRHTRNNIVRTDRLRTLSTERVQDESLDPRDAATSLVSRNLLTVRSQDVLLRGNNDDRRFLLGDRIAKNRENHGVRSRERDEMKNVAERRNIHNLVRDEEITSRLSTIRPVVERNERIIRSLGRLSRSNDDRIISFENARVVKQERENRDVRAREQDEFRNKAEQRNIETRVRERSNVDREISARFLRTRQLTRNVRSVGSADRLSRERIDDRRLSFENVRIATLERENSDVREQERPVIRSESERCVRQQPDAQRDVHSRYATTLQFERINALRTLGRLAKVRGDDRTLSYESLRITKQEGHHRDSYLSYGARGVRARERDSVTNKAEQRIVENRVRERTQKDREIDSRFLLTRQANNNKERRLTISPSRRNMQSRFSDEREQAYGINSERTIDDGYRNDQRYREQNDYDRRTADSQFAARSQTEERNINQIRNVREHSRENYRHESLKDRRAREMTGRRVSRSETRLFENKREHGSLNARERVTNENRRTSDERIAERIQNQRLSEVSRNFKNRDSLREMSDKRDNERASRHRSIERRSADERIDSNRRSARQIQRRISEIRDSRYRDSESRYRNTAESRLSSRAIERDNVRNADRRKTHDVDERRDYTRNVLVPKITLNMDSTRNHVNTFGHKAVQNENKAYGYSWQNLIYTLQGIYLCSIFLPMLMKSNSDKKKSKLSLGMWTPLRKLIKTD